MLRSIYAQEPELEKQLRETRKISTMTDMDDSSLCNFNATVMVLSDAMTTTYVEEYEDNDLIRREQPTLADKASEKLKKIKKKVLSTRGMENIHIYIWILKDLAWCQLIEDLGMIFGSLALIWCGILFFFAYIEGNYEDMYMLVALTLWIFGNFWWMKGELVNGDDDVDAPQGGYIFMAALGWIVLYHLVLQPLGLFQNSVEKQKLHEDSRQQCRFSYFKTWRQYEHAHTFFWCGKDLGWNLANPILWIIFIIPTFLIGLDFIVVTWNAGLVVDSAHYIAQLLWVCGNIVWAGSEVFLSNYDTAYYIFQV